MLRLLVLPYVLWFYSSSSHSPEAGGSDLGAHPSRGTGSSIAGIETGQGFQ